MNAHTRKIFVKIKKCLLSPFTNNPLTVKKTKKFHDYMRSRVEFSEPPTIISTNCVGGIISHNLGMKFMSPTVNLTICNRDFLKFITNFEHYLNCELVIDPEGIAKKACPVGNLDDIEIIFNHYKTFEEAKEKWNERKKRINFENLYIMMPLGIMTADDLEILKTVKCKRKIVFSTKAIPGYDFIFPLKRYEGKMHVGQIAGLEIDGFRPFEKEFDYVAWLNGKDNFRTQYFKKYRSEK